MYPVISLLFPQFLFHSYLSSSLFPDVVNCMQTDNLELKKLVYLYLMNYAKSQPDMAIMAVNSFVKVTCSHGSSKNGPPEWLPPCLPLSISLSELLFISAFVLESLV